MTMTKTPRWLRAATGAAALLLAAQASAGVTFYEREGYGGVTFRTDRPVDDLQRQRYNDRASSIVVTDGAWEVCEDAGFNGRCAVLQPGRYPTLTTVGLNDRISSVRPARLAPDAPPSITFYDLPNFRGANYATDDNRPNLGRDSFNDRASSAVVTGGEWEICSDPRFGGRCMVLRQGDYPSLASIGLDDRVSSVRRVDGSPPPPVAIAPSVSFYEQEGFRGRSFTTGEPVINLDRQGFNGRAGSVDVIAGTWEFCEDPRFGGRCVQLAPGRYPSPAAMGLSDRVASVRAAGPDARVGAAPVPAPQPVYDARRRGDERLYQANVTSVRAVVAQAEQRCWVEREQVQQRERPNVGGAIAGAVIGGILGHQVGGGSGRDLATGVGAVAGAAVGANVNRDRSQATQDVQRCSTVDSRATPDYWDVTYNFRGVDHRVQMNTPPAATVTVNERGEPRV